MRSFERPSREFLDVAPLGPIPAMGGSGIGLRERSTEMTSPGFVNQQDLLRWADSVGARGVLRLMRRLILETGSDVVQLGFPSGEGVATSGWDGSVRSKGATAFIPLGLSLWELSVEKNVGTKAETDYAKRTTTPDGSPTVDCSYFARRR